MMSYANLRSDMKSCNFSNDYYLEACLNLDAQFVAISHSAAESWQYSTRFLDQMTERCYTSYLNIDPGYHVTQAWNVIRLARILLNEFILENGRDPPEGPEGGSSRMAQRKIAACAFDICASLPQYADCLGLARGVPSTHEDSENSEVLNRALDRAGHEHTPAQNMACYTLIFPLVVAGQSKGSPKALKSWIIKELHYMASHFCIRNAEIVAQILERGVHVNPWDVYVLLGSYAFVA